MSCLGILPSWNGLEMAWDEQRYDRFVDALAKMARGELPGYGYPHVVLPYQPHDELQAIEHARKLPSRLGAFGLRARAIPLAQLVATALSRYSRRALRDAEEYARLERDLSDPMSGVASRVCEELRKAIAEEPVNTVLVVARLGALYPFTHVSTLLEATRAAGVTHTLGVLYPGTADGTRLKFLGLVDPTGGYRGHVVT